MRYGLCFVILLAITGVLMSETVIYQSNFSTGVDGFEVADVVQGSVNLSTLVSEGIPSLYMDMNQTTTGRIVKNFNLSGINWWQIAYFSRIRLKAKAFISEGAVSIKIRCFDTEGGELASIDIDSVEHGSLYQEKMEVVSVPKAHPDNKYLLTDHAQLVIDLQGAQGNVWIGDVIITLFELSSGEMDLWNNTDPVTYGGCPWFDPSYSGLPLLQTDPMLRDTAHKLLVTAGVTKMRYFATWGSWRSTSALIGPAFEVIEGDYGFEQADPHFDEMGYYGIDAFMTVLGTPSWAHNKTAADLPDYKKGSTAENDPTFPPEDWGDYDRFVRALVSYFQDRVDTWEVWNEPDSWDFSCSEGIESYKNYLMYFYLAAKEVDPDCTVLCGRAWTWLPFLLRDGYGQYMDAVTAHPYPGAESPGSRVIDRVREYQKAMIAESTIKPIFISELGFGAGWDWPGPGGYRSEQIKAQRILEVLPQLAQLSNNIHWYAPVMRDRKYGFIQAMQDRYVPVDAYYAIATVSGALGQSPVLVEVDIPTETVFKNQETQISLTATNISASEQTIRFWPVGFVKDFGLTLDDIRSFDWQGTLLPGQSHSIIVNVLPNYKTYGTYKVGLAVVVENASNALELKDLLIDSVAYHSTPTTSYYSSGTSYYKNPVTSINAVNDLKDPAWSFDESLPILTWYPHKGTEEWIRYDFDKPTLIVGAEVYWVDDTRPTHYFNSLSYNQFRVPSSWYMEYFDGLNWVPFVNTSPYTQYINAFNLVNFDPAETSSVRLKVQLQPGYSGGVHELRMVNACSFGVVPADLNQDCSIDSYDLTVLIQNWLTDSRP